MNAANLGIHNQKLSSLLEAVRSQDKKEPKETRETNEVFAFFLTIVDNIAQPEPTLGTERGQEQQQLGAAGPPIPDRVREQMASVFQEWISLLSNPASKSFVGLMTYLLTFFR